MLRMAAEGKIEISSGEKSNEAEFLLGVTKHQSSKLYHRSGGKEQSC
jgi:hypothetical protein